MKEIKEIDLIFPFNVNVSCSLMRMSAVL